MNTSSLTSSTKLLVLSLRYEPPEFYLQPLWTTKMALPYPGPPTSVRMCQRRIINTCSLSGSILPWTGSPIPSFTKKANHCHLAQTIPMGPDITPSVQQLRAVARPIYRLIAIVCSRSAMTARLTQTHGSPSLISSTVRLPRCFSTVRNRSTTSVLSSQPNPSGSRSSMKMNCSLAASSLTRVSSLRA